MRERESPTPEPIEPASSNDAPKEAPKKSESLMDKFRRFKGVAVTAVALGIFSEQAAQAQEPVPGGKEKAAMVGATGDQYLAREDFRRLMDGVMGVEGAVGMGSASMEKLKTVRQNARNSELPDIVHDAVDKMKSDKAESATMQLVSMTSELGVQGMVYAELKKKFGHLPDKRYDSFFYGAHLKDFAPNGEDLRDVDIDPRLRQLEMWEASSDPGMLVRADLKENAAWASAERKGALRRLSEDKEVRAMGVQADLTVAEYLSVLKAAIVQGEEHLRDSTGIVVSPETEARLNVKMVMEAREKFAQRNILDKDTQHVITFTGKDSRTAANNGIDAGRWAKIAEAAGVKKEAVALFDARTEAPQLAAQHALEAMAATTGKTLLAFDTHGGKTSLSTSVDKDTTGSMDVQEVARALVQRAIKTGDEKSLADVTVVVDACYSHDFTKQLANSVKRGWNFHKMKNPEVTTEISLPTVITTAQENSMGIIGYGVTDGLTEQLGGIRADGAVTGERLLQQVQSESYHKNDMTFFVPNEEGRGLMEISANDTEPKTALPA